MSRRAELLVTMIAMLLLGLILGLGLGVMGAKGLPAPGPQCVELRWVEVAWVCVPAGEAM